jgi:hypothetical protein
MVNSCADAIDDLFGWPGAIVGWNDEGSAQVSIIWADGPIPTTVNGRLGLQEDGTAEPLWHLDGRAVRVRLLRAVSQGLWLAWIDLVGDGLVGEDIEHLTDHVPGDAIPAELQEAWNAQARRVPVQDDRSDPRAGARSMVAYVQRHWAVVHEGETPPH